jgi:hypothetical protein
MEQHRTRYPHTSRRAHQTTQSEAFQDALGRSIGNALLNREVGEAQGATRDQAIDDRSDFLRAFYWIASLRAHSRQLLSYNHFCRP